LIAASQGATCVIPSALFTSSLCALTNCASIDVTLFTAACGLITGGISNVLNITLPSTVTTFGLSSTSSITVGGLNIVATSNTAVAIDLSSIAVVTGNVIVSGNAVINAAAGKVVQIQGDLRTAATTTLNIAGNVTVAGATYIQGQLHLAGTFVQSTAQTAWLVATTTSVTVSGDASASASITGNGGIDASLVIQGNVSITPGNSPGAVYVKGDFTMSATSTLNIEVDSLTSYDVIYIGGRFNRNGILHVDLGDYRPPNGHNFIFATHTSQSGDFSISRGNLDETLSRIKPKYYDVTTAFEYSSAGIVALPIALIALCIVGLVF